MAVKYSCMLQVKSHADFNLLREQLNKWRKRFPMFAHDVKNIEKSLEIHMKAHMEHIIKYKQSKKEYCLVNAQQELDSINRIIDTVSKTELMALLSK